MTGPEIGWVVDAIESAVYLSIYIYIQVMFKAFKYIKISVLPSNFLVVKRSLNICDRETQFPLDFSQTIICNKVSKTFIQPEVFPPRHCYEVTKPHMR